MTKVYNAGAELAATQGEAITRLAASHDLDQGIKAIFAKEQPRFEGR